MESNTIVDPPIIRFNKIIPSVSDYVRNPHYDELGELYGISIPEIIESIVEDFSTFELATINNSPTTSLIYAKEYAQKVFSLKVKQQISLSWPPLISMDSYKSQALFFSFSKITSDCEDATRFLQWVILNLFPTVWNQSSSLLNPTIKAISKCVLEPDSSEELWAILDANDNFSLYEISDKTSKEIYTSKAQAIMVDQASHMVSIITPNNETKSFFPTEHSHAELWGEATTTNVMPLILYFSGISAPYPNILLNTIQFSITQTDGLFLRPLLMLKDVKGIDKIKLYEALFDISINEGKVNLLFSNVIITDLEANGATLQTMYSQHSATMTMIDVLFKRYIFPYYENFMDKLIKYIMIKGNLNLLNNKVDRKKSCPIYFTTLKYVCASYSFFPEQLKHFFSILRHYISIFQNNRNIILDFFGSLFYEKIINPLMSYPSHFDPSLCAIDLTPVSEMKTLIGSAFHHRALYYTNQDLGRWDDRLRFKMFPRIDSFLFAISECTETPSYVANTIIVLKEASNTILEIISEYNQYFMNFYQKLKDAPRLGTSLSWNFAVEISLLFSHASDEEEIKINNDNVANDYLNYLDNMTYSLPKVKSSPITKHLEKQIVEIPFPFDSFEDPPEVPKENVLPELPPLPQYNTHHAGWSYRPPIPRAPNEVNEAPDLPPVVMPSTPTGSASNSGKTSSRASGKTSSRTSGKNTQPSTPASSRNSSQPGSVEGVQAPKKKTSRKTSRKNSGTNNQPSDSFTTHDSNIFPFDEPKEARKKKLTKKKKSQRPNSVEIPETRRPKLKKINSQADLDIRGLSDDVPTQKKTKPKREGRPVTLDDIPNPAKKAKRPPKKLKNSTSAEVFRVASSSAPPSPKGRKKKRSAKGSTVDSVSSAPDVPVAKKATKPRKNRSASVETKKD